jgi:hypothetical protein
VTRPTAYQRDIRALVADLGMGDLDPCQIEAWMRLECNTLDWLSADRFRAEVAVAALLVRDYPKESAELAETYS